MGSESLDTDDIRAQFDFGDRVVTNNAASTQPPIEVLALYRDLVRTYENVHRGQSDASRATTERFEAAFDTIAAWLGAPGRDTISMHRNTTEAINCVMYTLLTEFRDGDNVVTTLMEHNSNYVPWYGLCREILPRFGVRVECRLARFDHDTGELDLEHLGSLVDDRTKLVACTGASNFLGTKPPLAVVRAIADASGYVQPSGESRSLLLVDGAQLVPTTAVDVQALDADYLAFSFHKLFAPFGVGVLYAKESIRQSSLPFLYGGDMIAEGQVTPVAVSYNELPWKFSAGTPNILGVIASAQTLRFVADLADPTAPRFFGTEDPVPRTVVSGAVARISGYSAALTHAAMGELSTVPGIRMYGPPHGTPRAPLIAFNVAGMSPFALAEALNARGIESRAGCHCATLAHHDLGLDPPASCRLSFAFYNTESDVDRAVSAVHDAVRARVSIGV